MQDTDGTLYGTTTSGGTGGGYGTAYKVTTAGSFNSLASFTNTTGATLGNASLTRLVKGSDGNFYGTTQSGGTGGLGTVFKVTPGGTFTTITSFTGTTGAALGSTPNTTLLLASDGNFYGTTTGGGAGNFGTIYKVAADGSGAFTSLLSFTGGSGAFPGSSPTANLVQGSDGNLYGATTGGGTGGAGTVYKVTPAGMLTSLVNFTGAAGVAPGNSPRGTLRQAGDGFFYGTTSNGGLYNIGTVFRVNAAGNFQSLYTFGTNNDGGSPNIIGTGSYPDVSDPYRLVTATDGFLYGVNAGSVFRMHQQPSVQGIAATNITPTDATLSGSVVPNQDAATAYYQYGFNTTYGSQTTTQNLSAGTSAVPVNAILSGLLPGVVYHYRLVTVTSQGTFYTADQTFATTGVPQVITGSFPNVAQTGFALDGVVNPLGTSTTCYFEYGPDITYGTQTATQSAGGGVANVPVSVAVNVLVPDTVYHVRLVATNSYGTTYGDDQVFRTFSQISTALSPEDLQEWEEGNRDPDEVVSTATFGTNTIQPISQYLNTGTAPLAGLFKATDGNFYGTTSTGGTFGSAGTVYRMSQGGTLTTLANFYNNTNATLSGNNPQSCPVQGADGNFYGTTNTGGASGLGCIFKMTPAGQVTILVSFNSSSVPLGSNPICGLTLGADGNFYGVTQNGGSSFLGTIFKVTPAGALTTLVSFTGTTGSFLGSSPRAALTLGADGNFYGTTATGGAGGLGTIFKVTPA
ncbi:MAG: choice-of-anchor tandem repeat GloVer-containing protein, partial [Chthoniobacteraceae bacterium]